MSLASMALPHWRRLCNNFHHHKFDPALGTEYPAGCKAFYVHITWAAADFLFPAGDELEAAESEDGDEEGAVPWALPETPMGVGQSGAGSVSWLAGVTKEWLSA